MGACFPHSEAVAERRYRLSAQAVSGTWFEAAPSATTRWGWQCAYPRPYGDWVANAAQEFSVPGELIWAVMRQESAFAPGAVSSAKAAGLMQLMPSTAEQVAKELRDPERPLQLTNPASNIRFGTYYLKKLLTSFGGNLALAVAGYNAGPNAVARWLKASPKQDIDLFVARIPYDETRHYVERVLSNYVRYTVLSKGPQNVPELPLESRR